MEFLLQFINNLDLSGILSLLMRVIAALTCIIIHECAHGFAAEKLGDPTARAEGRLTWNPIHHIDPFGVLMMVVAGVGWAKPVPVDARNFRHPRRGMAITALAGPLSNLVLAAFALMLAKWGYRALVGLALGDAAWNVLLFVFNLMIRIAVMSVGLAIFNLIPIPPLDGSKVLFSFLPESIYFLILRYERFVTLALFGLVFIGVLDAPLSFCIDKVLYLLCLVSGFPPDVLGF